MSSHDLEPDPDPPPRLTRDLHVLYGSAPRVPARIDDRIANLAVARLARRRGGHVIRWASVAAAVAIVFALSWAVHRAGAPSHIVAQHADSPSAAQLATNPIPTTTDARPLDTKAIDILDAFALARRLDAHQPAGKEWDANRDGVVDRRDVDALAMAAVQLKGEPTR